MSCVSVLEYRCQAEKGERPRVEEFAGPSLAIVCSGRFAFRSGHAAQLLANDFLLLGNPGQAYEISHPDAGGDRCLIFHFQEPVLAEIGDARRRWRGRRYFARSVLPPLPRATALRRLVEAGAAARLEIDEVAIASASHAMAEAGAGDPRAAPPPARDRRTRESIHRVAEWLERSIGEEVRLSEVARLAELSPYHFLRTFKREIGVTPYRFLVRARIRRALELLMEPGATVTEIAYAVGFGDLSNFVHTFRREVGSTPGRWRESVKAAGRLGGADRS